MRTQLSERVGVLEKWRWIIIGGSIIIGLMISNPEVCSLIYLVNRLTFLLDDVIMCVNVIIYRYKIS